MKKLFSIFIIFSLFVFTACGGSSSKDNSADNADSGDSTDDDRKQGDLYGECYPNETCNKGLICDVENNICIKDPGDGSNDSDSNASDSTPEQPDDTGDSQDGGDSADSTDDKDKTDSGDSQPDGDTSDSGDDSGDSQPDEDADTDTTPAADPCDPNPCVGKANSTEVCNATGETTYTCGCADGYVWANSQCLPECKKDTVSFPCYDPENKRFWTAISENAIMWQAAVDYCDSLNTSNYGGFADWHLPAISELRTLLIADKVKSSCPISEEGDHLSGNEWDCFSCAESCPDDTCNTSLNVCSPYEDGSFSKLGDATVLWSSSPLSEDSSAVWVVNSIYGAVFDAWNDETEYARCTRCTEGTVWNEYAAKCADPSKEIELKCPAPTNPDHTVWNDNGKNGKFTQKWNGTEWTSVVQSEYNSTEAGICRFKCEADYTWDGASQRCLPECSKNTTSFPCKDSDTGYIWSEKTDTWLRWEDKTDPNNVTHPAAEHCEGLNTSNYGGFNSGWHLPTISEIRTLIQDCPATQMPPVGEEVCAVRSDAPVCLSEDDCWTDPCEGCPKNEDGDHSKFGDDDELWSLSLDSDASNSAWFVDFSYGFVGSTGTINPNYYVRCVR